MRITAISSRLEHLELTRPYTIAFRTVDDVTNGIIEIRTDDGHLGLGAASPEPYVTGETHETCEAAMNENALDWLIGRDVRELPALCRELAPRMATTPAARAAVDMALHDLFGQHLKLPLVDVLGRAHTCMATSITVGIKSVADTVTEAEEYVGRGFSVLKIKLGHSLEEDIERLAKLRARFGEAITIRVDPNQGYSAADVLEFVDRTNAMNIESLEQPMKADDIDGLRSLPESIRARIMADETLLNEQSALQLLQPSAACGIFNIKLMKCGGIFAGRRMADLADIAGVELMWGCMDESIISISAALHAAFASPATCYIDLDGSFDLARDVVSGGFVVENGVMRTTDAPGLGVQLI